VPIIGVSGAVSGIVNVLLNGKNEFGEYSIFPKMPTLRLGRGKDETIDELNLENKNETKEKLIGVSEIVSELAEGYREVAATLTETIEDIAQNFLIELKNNLDGYEDNILYYDVLEDNKEILCAIYKFLQEHEEIEEQDLLDILKEYDKYVLIGESKEIEYYLQILINTINDTYKIGTTNNTIAFKTEENKKIMQEQLEDVSKVISDLAEKMGNNKAYSNNEEIKPNRKISIRMGMSRTTKSSSKVSGDSNSVSSLEDEKTLIILSDGMGSGEIAARNSGLVVRMLEKMLKNGFNKEVALNLINSNLVLNSKNETFATVDACIFDLYNRQAEFIKIGACPTYIRRKNQVEIVKSETLPVGILEEVDIDLFDKELNEGDILVMCTDGAIESNTDYTEKEDWIPNMLKSIRTNNPQKIADIIVSEAIDNGYGGVKDDITVVVVVVE